MHIIRIYTSCVVQEPQSNDHQMKFSRARAGVSFSGSVGA